MSTVACGSSGYCTGKSKMCEPACWRNHQPQKRVPSGHMSFPDESGVRELREVQKVFFRIYNV